MGAVQKNQATSGTETDWNGILRGPAEKISIQTLMMELLNASDPQSRILKESGLKD